MGRIVYNMSVSLDGRIATADGSLDWVTVDDEAHSLFNDEARAMSGFLMGRRNYELLQAHWPNADKEPGAPDVIVDFASIWRRMPKYVFSRTLRSLDDPTATLVGEVTREGIERIKEQAGGDLSVGGPELAGALVRLGLVDEYVLYLNAVVLGEGPRFFPAVEQPQKLRLESLSRLSSGVVRLAYSA